MTNIQLAAALPPNKNNKKAKDRSVLEYKSFVEDILF